MQVATHHIEIHVGDAIGHIVALPCGLVGIRCCHALGHAHDNHSHRVDVVGEVELRRYSLLCLLRMYDLRHREGVTMYNCLDRLYILPLPG